MKFNIQLQQSPVGIWYSSVAQFRFCGMNMFGGDSWAREAQHRKRRVDDLLLDGIITSSYKKLSNGHGSWFKDENVSFNDSWNLNASGSYETLVV